MSKISLALVAVVLTVMVAPSFIVRAQSAQRFEYVRVTPYTRADSCCSKCRARAHRLSGVCRTTQ